MKELKTIKKLTQLGINYYKVNNEYSYLQLFMDWYNTWQYLTILEIHNHIETLKDLYTELWKNNKKLMSKIVYYREYNK